MKKGRQSLGNILEDGSNKDLMNSGRICFSCEQIFASRKSLEEHVCHAASHICSCGTEFAMYEDMLYHSTTHEPGHQVLDHETIRKRRIEKCMEEEEKLRRIQSGEVWQVPKLHHVPLHSSSLKSLLQVPITSASQKSIQSAQNSDVSASYPSLLPSSLQSVKDMKNIFSDVGSPTVDLWTLYQPVVLVQTVRKFNKSKPYTCARCGEGFMSKNSLISHNSSHVTDRISGCIGCGLLLSSKKLVPRFHVCNAPSTATKFRLITAKPLNGSKKIDISGMRRNLNAQKALVTSSLQLKSRYTAASQSSQRPHVTSALQLKNQNIRAFNKRTQGPHGTPSLQFKSQNIRASKPYSTVPFLAKTLSPNRIATNKISWGLHDSHSGQVKTSTASEELPKSNQASSTPKGYVCRVCHIAFETAQLLQRHKCVKAKEFMAELGRGGTLFQRRKREPQITNLTLAQMNGDRKRAFPSRNQVVAIGLDKGKGAVPMNRTAGEEMEDDCYIVESTPDKSAEMIYQVTSSVPIKT